MTGNDNFVDEPFCPHEFYDKDMQLLSALEKRPDGSFVCKFCGKIFSTEDEAAQDKLNQ